MVVVDGFGVTLVGSVTGALGYIIDCPFLGIERGEIVTTVHGAASGYETKQPSSIKKVSDITVTLEFDKTQHALLMTAVAAAALETWTITDPDGNTWACSGFVKAISGDPIPVEDIIRGNIVMAFSGPMTYTAV